MYCPKCGNDLRGDRCSVCGYDRSSDYLLYPTLTPVDPGMTRTDPEEERLRSMYETALAVERAAATEAGFSAAALLYEQLGKPGWRDSAERARQCRAKVRQMEREEQERAERQRREQERQRREQERQEQERQEQERRERVRQERERRERERLEQERREQERRERDRAEREHLERERLARERERQEQERLERERIRREQERVERERQAAARRTVSAPQPARVQPQPARVQPQPARVQSQPARVQPQPVRIQPQPVRIQPRPQDWVRSGVPPQAVRQSEGKKKKKGLLGVLVLLAVLVALYLWLPVKLGDLPVARDLSNVFKSTASPRQTARPTARPTAAPTARPTAAPTARPATDLTVTDHVTDWAGMLSEDMRQELDALAGELSDAYQIDIRIITEGTISDEAEMEQFSDNVMERFDLGYGDDRDCIMILYFYSTGRYYLISSGYGEYAFDHYGLRMIISDIHDYMADSDWYNGFYLFLEDCAFFMDRALDGDPVREES